MGHKVTIASMIAGICGLCLWSLPAAAEHLSRAELEKLFASAENQASRHNLSGARDILTKILDADPQFQKARAARASVYCQMQRFEDALSDLDIAIKASPRDADLLMGRGACLIELGNRRYDRSFFERAEKDFTLVTKIAPGNGIAYNNRGLCFYSTGEYQKALEDHKKSCQLEPKEPKYVKNGAMAYLQLGDYANAIASFEKARSMQPGNFYRYYDLGRLYFTRGEPKKAIDAFMTCLKLNPKFAEGYMYRGLSYFDQEDYRKAVNDFDVAIALNAPPTVKRSCYRYRGLAYAQLGDKGRAQRDLDRFCDEEISRTHFEAGVDAILKKQGEESSDSLMAQGLESEEKGAYDDAISKFTASLARDRSNPSIYKLRAHAYLQKGDRVRALSDYDMAAFIDSFDADTFMRRALIHQSEGRSQKALWDLNRAIAADPALADPYFEKARICDSLGNHKEAILSYKRFTKLALLKNDKTTAEKVAKANEALARLKLHSRTGN